MQPLFSSLRGKIEFKVVLAALIAAGGLSGFMAMMEIARDAAPHGFDAEILLALRAPGDPATPIGPSWMPDVMRGITHMGGTTAIVLVAAAMIVYLLVARRQAAALFVLFVMAGGQTLSSLLKLAVDRPRPDLVPHLVEVNTLSFPSGHAMMSAVTFLTVAALLAQTLPGRATRIYVFAIAVLATFLIGFSRVYLGVHWPSDVVAGWCAGTAWAMLCWLVAHLSRQRKPGGA